MARRIGVVGFVLATIGFFAVADAASAAERLEWQVREADVSGKGRTSSLVYGVPETDAMQVTGVCSAGPASAAKVTELTLATDIGDLANGKDIDVRFSGGGVELTAKGHVVRAEGDHGLTGAVLSLEHSDPLWTLLAEKDALDYSVPGYKTSALALDKGRATIRKFIATCRTYAGAESAAGSGEKSANDEKEAFDSAKELGTKEAWDAFLANYPSGFHADLAHAYMKKLTDAGATPDAARASANETNSGDTHEISCKERKNVHSRKSKEEAKVTFINRSGMYRSLLWLDFDGDLKDYGGLDDGDKKTINTYVTHPWMVATGPGDCLQIFMPGAGQSTVVLRHLDADDGPRRAPKDTSDDDPPVKKKKTPLDYARESCKETGGYWTGSTCKASKNAKTGTCKQGYVWSSDAGACQWDGGPPKKPQQQQQTTGQQLIEGLQNLKKQYDCKAPRQWDGASKTCDCPGDSVFKKGKCVKENAP